MDPIPERYALCSSCPLVSTAGVVVTCQERQPTGQMEGFVGGIVGLSYTIAWTIDAGFNPTVTEGSMDLGEFGSTRIHPMTLQRNHPTTVGSIDQLRTKLYRDSMGTRSAKRRGLFRMVSGDRNRLQGR